MLKLLSYTVNVYFLVPTHLLFVVFLSLSGIIFSLTDRSGLIRQQRNDFSKIVMQWGEQVENWFFKKAFKIDFSSNKNTSIFKCVGETLDKLRNIFPSIKFGWRMGREEGREGKPGTFLLCWWVAGS